MSKDRPVPLDRPDVAIVLATRGGNTQICCWSCSKVLWVRTGSHAHHKGLCSHCLENSSQWVLRGDKPHHDHI